MVKFLLITFLLLGFCSQPLIAQTNEKPGKQINTTKMDNAQLDRIIHAISDEVEGKNGSWRFVIQDLLFICLTDETHNRMRIISPVEKMEDVSNDQIRKCLEANFHTALDSKYAISDDVLWSTFIHPLNELTNEQVIDAISQVYSCVKTFGNTYSSGALSFPSNEEKESKIRRL